MNEPVSSSRYVAETTLPAAINDAFAYHERRGCLQRLVPPWESVVVEHSDDSLEPGSRVVLKTRLAGLPLRWHALHTELQRPRLFADVQESGPFAHWSHQHRFEAVDSERATLRDEVTYQVPLGPIGRIFGGGIARRTLEAMFAYRHRVTFDDLHLQTAVKLQPQTIAVSGASGLVGECLCSLLTLLGHRVFRITRGQVGSKCEIAAWGQSDERDKLESVDTVVHLAGKSIASGRWNSSVKDEIRSSRVELTRQLCETIANCQKRPATLICASATGIYGDRGDESLTEDSAISDDFLASVAAEWEAACQPARDAGVRVVNARFGIVISPAGGALQKMLLPAKLFGGALGNGKQYWSWIGLDDVVGGIVHAIATESLTGPVNFVAPNPITNRQVAVDLASVLRRKAIFPAPALALRIALGEMADALLLSSTKVLPEKLIDSGYQFRFTELKSLLRYCLGRERLESVA
ncbi:MAG: TIGR01777 family oxidoreductase [Planctomycetota bacterium]